jgi:hypothetical protein
VVTADPSSAFVYPNGAACAPCQPPAHGAGGWPATRPSAQRPSVHRSPQLGHHMCCGLDLRRGVLGFRNLLRQPSYGLLKRPQFPSVGQFNRLIEFALPTVQWREPSLSTPTLNPSGNSGTSVVLHTGQGAPAAPQSHAYGPSQGRSGCASHTQWQSSQREQVAIKSAAMRAVAICLRAARQNPECPTERRGAANHRNSAATWAEISRDNPSATLKQ